MKFIITNALLGFIALFLIIENSNAQQLAFPGAEGFGKYASGGRNGSVYHVTNLDDSGDGSFREAVSESNRTVVFDVGGVINITDRIVIHSNVTVAGQTAPGGGITIYGNGVAFNGDSGNNIIRYIRIRMGVNGTSGKDAVAISDGTDYMFDHVSISWGRDGTLDVNGTDIDDLTFQDCIVSQGINNLNHSTGGLMQSGKWSMIRSLYIDNKTRNPKARGTHEFINSVLYNWNTNGYILGDTEGDSECNMIGSYFIYGPSSNSGTHFTRSTKTFYIYAEDNWVDKNKNGTLDGSLITDYLKATVMDEPYDYPGVDSVLSAQDALNHVIDHVGASLVRDEVDILLINQLTSYGKKGSIINTEENNGIDDNVGTVVSGTAPTDTDQDGMPDDWETDNGMDPDVASNNNDLDGDGYTDLEEYLDWLVNVAPYIPAELTKQGTGSSTQTVDINTAIEEFYYTWENATTVTVTGLPLGVSYDINSDDQTVTISGTPMVTGEYDFTVTTVSSGIDSTLTGSITVNSTDNSNYIAIQENETGFCSCDGTIDTDNEGFTGDGFANTENAIGEGVDWKVYVPAAGDYDFYWRYANGGSADRPAKIILNDTTVVEEYSLDTTSDWEIWLNSATQTLSLLEGDNTIRLEAITEGGLSNIDYMFIAGENPIAGNCNGPTGFAENVTDVNTELIVYPNPVEDDEFLVKVPANFNYSEMVLTIYDIQGSLVYSSKYLASDELHVNTNLNSGSYILQLSNSKSFITKKLMVK